MTTLSTVSAPVEVLDQVEKILTIDTEAGKVLLDDLDYALAELLNLHTQGGYIKKSEVMDLLLDFRQSIENFPAPGES